MKINKKHYYLYNATENNLFLMCDFESHIRAKYFLENICNKYRSSAGFDLYKIITSKINNNLESGLFHNPEIIIISGNQLYELIKGNKISVNNGHELEIKDRHMYVES